MRRSDQSATGIKILSLNYVIDYDPFVLQNSRRRPVRGVLYVSGDGLRVVDDETKV